MQSLYKEYEYLTGNWRLSLTRRGWFSNLARWLFGKDCSLGYELVAQVEQVVCFRNVYGDWQDIVFWVNASPEDIQKTRQYIGIADAKSNKWLARIK